MEIMQQDMCPFSYWRAREINSECTGVVNVMGRTCVLETKGLLYVKKQKDMCPCSYWRAREVNSEYSGKFHQSPETKKKGSRLKRQKK